MSAAGGQESIDGQVAYDGDGLVPCVVQDWSSGEVLTLAYMNEEALRRTRATGELHLWSRSRGEQWHKGETSGNVQSVRSLRLDCDGDTLLALVEPAGPACHTGKRTCFHRGELEPPAPFQTLTALERTVTERARERPAGSYTVALLDDPQRIGEKVMEEAEEVARAAREESAQRVDEEAAGARSRTPSGCSMAVAPRAAGAPAEDPPRAGSPAVGAGTPEGFAGAIEPDLQRACELARAYNLIPLSYSFIEDCETPVSAFLKLRALAPGEPTFLLESADQGQRVGRWSFIGFRPRAVLRWSLADGGDPYRLAAERVAAFKQAPMDGGKADGGRAPFLGGAVGFFGYDLVRTVEPLGDPPGGLDSDSLGLPDMALMFSDALVAFDHLKHTVTILANADLQAEPDIERAYAQAARTIAEVRGALAGPVPRGEPIAADERTPPQFQSNMSRERFEAMVERVVQYIYAGDAFQVVPSQRWSAPTPVEAFSIYRGLRAVNPSPYMYFLDFGDFQIAGASPEPLLTVNGRHVSTKPIAGTRPRGANPEEDRRIEAELLADEKERAEHVMLVDLGRNDLGRVCEYGSVKVDELMEIESYSHVMHIVSSVSGTLREGVGAMDALRSVLPAGTLSGAPKVRAMQIIDELEPVKRGGYGGAVGYLSYAGDLDTAIHIRTVVVKDGVAHVQAGGGTVAQARPEYEYEESVAKSTAAMRAIELACAQPDWP
jgi:anthranilate synthase component 1